MTKRQPKLTLHHDASPSVSLDETRPLVLIIDDDAAIRQSLHDCCCRSESTLPASRRRANFSTLPCPIVRAA